MSKSEIDEIYVIYKEIMINKLKIIEFDKKGLSLIPLQEYGQISSLNLEIKLLYVKLRKSQERLNFLITTNIKSDSLLQNFDLKVTLDEIDENTIPKMKILLMNLENLTIKTEDIENQIVLLKYFTDY